MLRSLTGTHLRAHFAHVVWNDRTSWSYDISITVCGEPAWNANVLLARYPKSKSKCTVRLPCCRKYWEARYKIHARVKLLFLKPTYGFLVYNRI